MRLEKRKQPKRMLALLLTLVLAITLFPFSVFAEDGWDSFNTDVSKDVSEAVLGEVNTSLAEKGLAFTFTKYEAPSGAKVDLSGENLNISSLPTGTLSVTVTDKTAQGEAEEPEEPEKQAPTAVEVALPAGTYTIAYHALDVGKFISSPSVGEGETLTITEGAKTELSYEITTEAPAPAKPDLNDYVTGMTLKVNNGEPVKVTSGSPALELKVGDEIDVTGEFHIDDPWMKGFRLKTPYEVGLPQILDYTNSASTTIHDENGNEIGKFALDSQNQTASFTFEELELTEETMYVSGSFGYWGTVKASGSEQGEALEFTVNGGKIIIPITWAKTEVKITKAVEPVKGTGNAMARWTITIPSKEGKFPQGLTVTDAMTFNGKPFHELREMEQVQIDGTELAETDYTVSTESGNGFNLVLLKEQSGNTMTIVFTSNLSAAGAAELGGTTSIENDAYYSRNMINTVTVQEEAGAGDEGGGLTWGTATAEFKGGVYRILRKIDETKLEVGADGAQTQVWKIFVNRAFMQLPIGTKIIDTFQEGLDFSSVKLLTYTGNNPDNPSSYTVGKFEDYFTLTESEQEVDFTLTKALDQPVLLEVRTTLSEGSHSAQNYSNRASITFGNATFTVGAGSGKLRPGTSLYKDGGKYDPTVYDASKRYATWNVYVGNTTGSAVLTDTMQGGNNSTFLQELVLGDDAHAIQIQKLSNASVTDVMVNGAKDGESGATTVTLDADGTASTVQIDGVTFTVSYDTSAHRLKVEIDDALNAVYRIRYVTLVSNAVVYNSNIFPGDKVPESQEGPKRDHKVTNTAELTVDGNQDKWSAEWNESFANFDKAEGRYDRNKLEISWAITANVKKLSYQSGTFKIYDRIPAGLEFVTDKITVSADGKDVTDKVDMEVSENGRLLVISIKADAGDVVFNQTVKASVVTKITDDGLKALFTSGSMNFENQGYQSGKDSEGTTRWEGDWGNCTITCVPIEKSAVYNTKTASIDWTVKINPNYQGVIDLENGHDVVDQMTVQGLGSTGIAPSELVTFDAQSLRLKRFPNSGTLMGQAQQEALTPLTSLEDMSSAAGHCYYYDPATLTLTLHIAPGDETAKVPYTSSDYYRIVYSTPLNVPDDYEGTDTVSVENSVNWSGYKEDASAENIKLATVKATLGSAQYGRLTVSKVDVETKEPLPGAYFTLYQIQADGTKTPMGNHTTNEKGVATFIRLMPGAYTLVETSAPKGYAISEAAANGIDVTIEKVNGGGSREEITVENQFIQGTIQITKVDAADEAKTLAGAQFTLYAKDAAGEWAEFKADGLTNPATTGEDGTVTFENLPAGEYEVRETLAPDGYFRSEDPISVTVGATQTYAYTVKNTLIENFIQITKTDALDGRLLAGAQFTLYTMQDDGLVKADVAGNPATSNADGVAEFKNLPVGSYVIKETQAPDGYELNSAWQAEAAINKEQTEYTFPCANAPILGKLQVMKVTDVTAADGSKTPLAGAQFQLLSSDKTTVVATSALTNQAGLVTFDKLRLGTYYLKEIVAPEGYDLSAELREVKLTEGQTTVSVFVENHKTEIPDIPPESSPSVPPENPPENPPEENIPDDNTPTGGRDDDGDDDRTPIRVVDPGDLTPQEVETLIEDGFVPLDDRPDLTPEQIIAEDIPLVLIPDEEVPLAMMPGLPQTGDETPVGLLALLLAVSLAGLIVLLRKPKHDDQA